MREHSVQGAAAIRQNEIVGLDRLRNSYQSSGRRSSPKRRKIGPHLYRALFGDKGALLLGVAFAKRGIVTEVPAKRFDRQLAGSHIR
ncbi:MAG: hypothetical protein WA936_14545 [Erythrobacter sp.]|uniref:hypothetical protein n=1 Tax=Erythrobacter sp. TaxID=1042 RepID=UPI003C758DB6